MCRLLLLIVLLTINIHASDQKAPILGSCRDLHKAQSSGSGYNLSTAMTCENYPVRFPVQPQKNFTDHRNCKNYMFCVSMSCSQCPCPDGQTFNPNTKECDNTNAPCVCPNTATTTVRPLTTATTTAKRTTKITTKGTPVVIKGDGAEEGKQQGGHNSKPTPPPVSSEVIIIAGIVSATVIVIVVIVMAVFCWQRRHSQQIETHSKPPKTTSSKKLSAPNPEGYSSSIPPTEKHEYAEIDERMINGRKHWQHGGSLRAPPLPNHQPPPTSPTFTGMCPHHQHARSDSGLGSADTSFTANYPRRTFQPINPAHSIKIGVAYNERPTNTTCCGCDEPYHGREDSSASSESQYSNSSNPISVDSRDVDMKTPLHSGKQNYVSKQVYI